jgi:putative transposase
MEEEIRKEAISRHLVGGESPKAVYTSLNRSKKWFFKWLKRFQTGAVDWYKEHSKAPRTKPNAISPQEKEIIVATRTRLESAPYAQVGASAIKWELQKLGVPLRSDSTVNRTLKREGLVKKNWLCSQGSRIPLLYRPAVLQ